jgi:transketolase
MSRVDSVVSDDLRTKCHKRLVQMHHESQVGHLGGNLSCLDAMLVVHHEFMETEDRFVLSKGHSAGALYITLWSLGKITDEQLAQFHRDGTSLPGHPPSTRSPEIPFATGSLGHGLSLAAGLALSNLLRKEDKRIYCLTSDGEWQEGSTWEALAFSCSQNLSNLTVLVDHNGLQGFGKTSEVSCLDPLWERLIGFPADVHVVDGHDVVAIRQALSAAQSRLKVVCLKTVKGKGIPGFEHEVRSHYVPVSKDEYQLFVSELGTK